jgi:hypothetical protein
MDEFSWCTPEALEEWRKIRLTREEYRQKKWEELVLFRVMVEPSPRERNIECFPTLVVKQLF